MDGTIPNPKMLAKQRAATYDCTHRNRKSIDCFSFAVICGFAERFFRGLDHLSLLVSRFSNSWT
jgi:hypothetical protein